jgi:predicted MFS family arabinose efflux permease
VFLVAAAGLTAAAQLRAAWPALVACAALAGLSSLPVGALTRSRWSHLIMGGGAGAGRDGGRAPGDRLQTAFALESVLDEVSWIFGPTVATVCASLAWPGIGVRPEAGVVAMLGLMAVGGPLFLSARGSEPPVRPRERQPSAIRSSGVWPVAVSFVGVGLIFGGNNITVVAMCEWLGSKALAGPVGGVGSVAALCAALWYGSRRWRGPLARRFLFGLFALTAAAALYLLVNSYVSIALVTFCLGLGLGPTFVNGNALIESLVPRESLTEGLTWISTALGVGTAAGSAVAGRLIDAWGARAGYWVVCAGALTAVAVASLGLAQSRRRAASN